MADLISAGRSSRLAAAELGDADSPENIGKTRRYIEDFSAAVEKAYNFTDLYEAMVAVYPGRVNRAVIWHSAKAFLA